MFIVIVVLVRLNHGSFLGHKGTIFAQWIDPLVVFAVVDQTASKRYPLFSLSVSVVLFSTSTLLGLNFVNLKWFICVMPFKDVFIVCSSK